ncbi:MAG: hypothetical protein KGY61_07585 [Desulfobacterales bacterium]|nr:hypothetical protein [Desulfobacterales bacterium]
MRSSTVSNKDVAVDAGLWMVLRYAVYTLLMFALTTSLPLILQQENIAAFKEGELIEWCQLILLISASGILLYGAFTRHQGILRLLGCLSAFAALRELDTLFDRMLPVTGWKIGYLIIVYALVSVYMDKKAIKDQIRDFLKTHAVVILWTGFLVAIPIGQLVGHGTFLKALMGEDYIRDYKRIIEESLELMGYLLILAGSIEALVERGKVEDERWR